jgi:hypothetical protein
MVDSPVRLSRRVEGHLSMHDWIADIEFERIGPALRLVKKLVFNPLANYLPADWWRTWLREGRSELALANWFNPGGWRSMVISYTGQGQTLWDKLLVNGGSIPMALRNRRRLVARLVARLLDRAGHDPAHMLCLGAGPGLAELDGMQGAGRRSEATLVDLNNDAFEYGLDQARQRGLADRVRYLQGDVRDIHQMLDKPVDLVTMIGICEYIEDEQLVSILQAASKEMAPGTAILFNSLAPRHGTDRFFRRVFGLHMRHRSPEQLAALFEPAGFGEYIPFPEPLGVYTVVIGRKTGGSAKGGT